MSSLFCFRHFAVGDFILSFLLVPVNKTCRVFLLFVAISNTSSYAFLLFKNKFLCRIFLSLNKFIFLLYFFQLFHIIQKIYDNSCAILPYFHAILFVTFCHVIILVHNSFIFYSFFYGYKFENLKNNYKYTFFRYFFTIWISSICPQFRIMEAICQRCKCAARSIWPELI